MKVSSGKWRGFFAHLGPYLIIITMLAIINLLTSPDTIWFVWPALGWGVGIAFHLLGILVASMQNMSGKWRGFLSHFGSYAIIITLLASINFLSSSDSIWFIYPALGWGAAVAIHFWGTLMSSGGSSDKEIAEAYNDIDIEEESIIQGDASNQGVMEDKLASPPAVEKQPEIQSAKFSDPIIQAHLDKAAAYKTKINELVNSTTNQDSRARLQDLALQVDDWIQAITLLARRIEYVQQDNIIHQDLASVPQSIKSLEDRLETEHDEGTRNELERALQNRRNQLLALEKLDQTMRRAEVKIESTLSSLGTIYSQILTTQSTNHVADYNKLSTDVEEEVNLLRDHLEALEEVKLGQIE